MTASTARVNDTPALRKARGAFFTPPAICDYVVDWAVRRSTDAVLEPSCGEAAFLLAAAERARTLGDGPATLDGIELHPTSASRAAEVMRVAGHAANVTIADFFSCEPAPRYDAVVGNPPYVRYQDFTGDNRLRSREAALRGGVALTGLASSWAAFTVHAALFLKPGGRLGLVLPAELLTVNYAAEVRRFLMERFRVVRLVVFHERVFPGVLAEVVLVLADGFDEGPTDRCELVKANNIADVATAVHTVWHPPSTSAKWTASMLSSTALKAIQRLHDRDGFAKLQAWGETTLGMVTGNNRYFMLTPADAKRRGLSDQELLPMSPPGSRHLRALRFSAGDWRALGDGGGATLLFRPEAAPSAAGQRYIADGERLKVDQAYKCRVRKPWWRVPLVPPADLFLTYMNADTPRLCANESGVRHLNSVHGLYLHAGLAELGRTALPIASLNSMTLLGAEMVGRAYGGGVLKLEPKEADLLPVPSPAVLESVRGDLIARRREVEQALVDGTVTDAASIVDEVLLTKCLGLTAREVEEIRAGHRDLYARRIARGDPPRPVDVVAP